MKRIYFSFLIVIVFMFIIIYYMIFIKLHYNNDFYFTMKLLEKKLLYYMSKYSNCTNYTTTPLYCGHIYEGYKLQKKGVYPENIIVNLSKYKTIKCSYKTKCFNKELIVGVVTSPEQIIQRMSLRMGYKDYNNLMLIFFTGLSRHSEINDLIKKESNYYNDMIVYNFISHYFNSSLMFSLEIKWVHDNCYSYKYFIYHTPDVFFNYPLFFRLFLKNRKIYPLIGQILKKNRVIRSNRSRFYVPYTIYNKTHYPPQPNGPLVAFSNVSIERMILNINKIEMTFWMDDVFLSFLIKKSRIKWYNLKNVISMYPVQIKTLPNISFIISHIIYIHSLPPAAILYLIQASKQL